VDETAQIKTSDSMGNALVQHVASAPPPRASVRVSPGSYFSALFVFTVLGALMFRSQFDRIAFFLVGCGWLLMPVLALADRIVFDGKFISRRGLVGLFERMVKGRNLKLSVDDVERVETMAVRTLIHGGRVHYRYRSEVSGKGLSFTFASGGESYRSMARSLFSQIASDKLDMRSSELRDYLVEPKVMDRNVFNLNLALTDEKEKTNETQAKRRKPTYEKGMDPQDQERGLALRQSANQLRALGRLKQAAEAFRRALSVLPNDNWLLFEFARFLRSQASTLRDARLLRRSSAALRLATIRAKEDAKLLSRIGESYFEFGDMERAAAHFRKALDADSSSFRAEMGLAEIGIRNGKLAHVIHHYSSAARMAPDKALKRFVQREVDYYSTLNNDEDYLDSEIRRIDRLQFVLFARRCSSRVTLVAFIVALLGTSLDNNLSNVGWTFTATSLGLWFFTVLVGKLFTKRRAIPSVE
jgi:tetratricopeptide (TPR) repeat protein